MTATIVRTPNMVYGIVPVPGTDTLGVFCYRDEAWIGVSSVNFIDGSCALLGHPIPEVAASLDEALVKT